MICVILLLYKTTTNITFNVYHLQHVILLFVKFIVDFIVVLNLLLTRLQEIITHSSPHRILSLSILIVDLPLTSLAISISFIFKIMAHGIVMVLSSSLQPFSASLSLDLCSFLCASK